MPPSPIPTARLAHVGLHVTDMAAMVAFYTQLFGLVVTDEGEHTGRYLTFLSRDADEHHQIVLVTGRRTHPDDVLLSQLSFRVDDLDALRWFAGRATELGATEVDPRNHGNSWSVYFLDPEANRVEVYTPTPWYIRQPWRSPLDLAASNDSILAATRTMVEGTDGWMSADSWRASLSERLSSGTRA